ncbi:MAG: hypothetical protein AAF151_25800 [Cyanobacteria bacterium J06656_5]
MIKHTEYIKLPLAAEQLFSRLKENTIQAYQPISCGYTHSYELKKMSDFRLMEGVIVPPHDDGIAGYRAILILHNPSNSYIIRGTNQNLSPQKRGTMVVLDINAQHEVRSKDPNGRLGSWAGLVWGLGGHPLIKTQWSVEKVAKKAKDEFISLCHSILEENLETTKQLAVKTDPDLPHKAEISANSLGSLQSSNYLEYG